MRLVRYIWKCQGGGGAKAPPPPKETLTVGQVDAHPSVQSVAKVMTLQNTSTHCVDTITNIVVVIIS